MLACQQQGSLSLYRISSGFGVAYVVVLSRIFISQDTLGRWLSEGKASVDGEIMTWVAIRQRFVLQPAVHFVSEVSGTPDVPELVGKVKGMDDIRDMQGEHYADSVVLGENAYQVVEGFTGLPIEGKKWTSDITQAISS